MLRYGLRQAAANAKKLCVAEQLRTAGDLWQTMRVIC